MDAKILVKSFRPGEYTYEIARILPALQTFDQISLIAERNKRKLPPNLVASQKAFLMKQESNDVAGNEQ